MPDAGWREGARSGDPNDECPQCHAPGCIFASDFKKMGRRSVRVCAACCTVSVNGKAEGPLVVTKKEGGLA